jgi:hypothetical protein
MSLVEYLGIFLITVMVIVAAASLINLIILWFLIKQIPVRILDLSEY